MSKTGKKIHKKPFKVKEVKNTNHNISIKNLALCLILSIILVMILTFILAIISVNSTILDDHLGIWEIAVTALALLVSGFICGRKNGAKGLYNGLILGALFAIVIMVFSLSNSSFNTVPFLIKTATALLSGGIGGIIGVK
jgi:putative membrane protein (TIGR04086 family)